MNDITETQATLLLVDDEASILSSLRRLLRPAGYTIHMAESGAAGLDILEREPVDLVVMDWSMPGLSGRETLAALGRLNPLLPVVVCTGYLLDPEQAPGCAAVLQKPVSGEGMKAVVRGVLRGGRLGAQVR